MCNSQDLWNLTPLFSSKESLEESLFSEINRAVKFEQQYKGQLATLDYHSFSQAIKGYEKFVRIYQE